MVAFATGGLWITHNDGASWTALFDQEEVGIIGALAVRWGKNGQPQEIWIGTGNPMLAEVLMRALDFIIRKTADKLGDAPA